MWLFREMLHSAKSKRFSSINFSLFSKCIRGPDLAAVRSLENDFAGRMNSFAGRIWPAGCSLDTPDIEEWAQRIEVNDDEHSLFMALRLGCCYLPCVEQNAWMLFQITWGQWGTFVQPVSISCCFLWVRYGERQDHLAEFWFSSM